MLYTHHVVDVYNFVEKMGPLLIRYEMINDAGPSKRSRILFFQLSNHHSLIAASRILPHCSCFFFIDQGGGGGLIAVVGKSLCNYCNLSLNQKRRWSKRKKKTRKLKHHKTAHVLLSMRQISIFFFATIIIIIIIFFNKHEPFRSL